MRRVERQAQNYDLQIVNRLNDSDLSTLMSEELMKFSFSNLIYYLSILVPVFLLCYSFIQYSISDFISQFIVGIVSGFLLIPIHELLHGLYLSRLSGESVDYYFNFRKMHFSASIHHFILSRIEYIVLLLIPFTVILMFFLMLFFVFTNCKIVFLSALLMHVSTCAGDFSLINFVKSIKRKNLKIYYDRNEGATFFTMLP